MKVHQLPIIFTSLTLFLLLAVPLIAAESKSASPSATISKEEIRQKLKERLDKNVQGTRTTAETVSAESTRTVKLSFWQGVFGTVVEATNSSVLLETYEKDQVKVTVVKDADLSLVQPGRAKRTITPAEIKPGWFIIAMGKERTGDVLHASRLSLTTESTPNPVRKTLVGKITEVDDNSLTIIHNGKPTTASVPKDLTLKIRGIKAATIAEVNSNDKAMAVIEEVKTTDKKTKEEIVVTTVRSLYAVPSLSNAKTISNQENSATASAEATPSASASPSASPKPKR